MEIWLLTHPDCLTDISDPTDGFGLAFRLDDHGAERKPLSSAIWIYWPDFR
jgi:hypothetical protein